MMEKCCYYRLWQIIAGMLLFGIMLWLGVRFTTAPLVETDLGALLPADQSLSAAERSAVARNEALLNRQIIVLVGAEDREKATSSADEIARQWQTSGLFATVRARTVPDLAKIQQTLSLLSVALLPEDLRDSLTHHPADFFAQRARDIANPFATSFIPLDQDWLGLSAAAMTRLNVSDKVQWDAASGYLLIQHEEEEWVLLSATLPEANGIINTPDGLLPLLQATQNFVAKEKIQILMAGGAIFAAEGRETAQRESRLMSVTGVVLTLLLLLAVFRNIRTPLLFIPAVIGLVAGSAATLAVFGQIHVLTLVIGTSLLGLLIDFPLHWLSKAVAPNWNAQQAMRRVLPTFVISLAVTVSGYAILLVTPLPILRQSAVFSVAALFGAFLCTVLLLPSLYRHADMRPATWLIHLAALVFRGGRRLQAMLRRPVVAILWIGLTVTGLWQSNWQDDIRQWVDMPPTWLQQAVQIGELTGMSASGQFLLIRGKTPDAVLSENRELDSALRQLKNEHKLDGFTSLGQWIMPLSDQEKTQSVLRALADRPDAWQAMRELGVPDAAVRGSLLAAAHRLPVRLSESLSVDVAEPYRMLWLGKVGDDYAAMVRLFGVRDVAALQALADTSGYIRFVDQRARLNHLFDQTKNEAVWLKLASYVFALVLLTWIFGVKRGLKILAVPLSAAVMTLAVLGLMGETITLFSVFGLLLVTAIGVDYAVYANNRHIGQTEKRCGIVLAASTTMLSFALLALSSTPAVAGFGLSVALGVLFNVLFCSWLFDEADVSV